MRGLHDLNRGEREAILGLASIQGIGASLATRLIDRFGAAESVFQANSEDLEGIEGIGKALLQRLLDGPDIAKAQRLWEKIEEKDLTVWVYGTPSYPDGLNRLTSPPLLIYTRGDLPCPWDERKAVAIVGTRQPNQRGAYLTRELSQHLAERGWWVVSGGALGVDSVAHTAALEVGGCTLGVMATGADCPYPPQNHQLFRQMVERQGGLLSEFPPGTKAERGHFPRRNRLISGLSSGVVVVQCGAKSGALNTADAARRIDVPLFTYPGLPREALSAGPHQLIRKGAYLIESPEEIPALLSEIIGDGPQQLDLWGQDKVDLPLEKEDPKKMGLGGEGREKALDDVHKNLPPLSQKILQILSGKQLHLDDIAHLVERPVSEVSANLVTLELDGFVFGSPQMVFSRSPF